MNITKIIKKIIYKEDIDIKNKIIRIPGIDKKKKISIYKKHFKYSPINIIYPKKKYNLQDKHILDCGSNYGQFLMHFGKDSIGIEFEKEKIAFTRSLGYKVASFNLEEKFQDKFPKKFDAVWCTNVLEHMVSPHLLLRRFREVLKKDGLLIIGVPTIPKNFFQKWLNKKIFGWEGYSSSEHINAFTNESVEFFIKRAGFEIMESNVCFPTNIFLNKLFNPLLKRLITQITVIAKRKENYKIPRIYYPKWIEFKDGY